jgi:hypothetical protein
LREKDSQSKPADKSKDKPEIQSVNSPFPIFPQILSPYSTSTVPPTTLPTTGMPERTDTRARKDQGEGERTNVKRETFQEKEPKTHSRKG